MTDLWQSREMMLFDILDYTAYNSGGAPTLFVRVMALVHVSERV
jgi:hypothetical protein